MKKLLFMLLLSTVLLSACSAKTTVKEDSPSTSEKSASKTDDNTSNNDNGDSSKEEDSEKVVDVEKGLFDVKLTIPETYLDGQTQDDLDKLSKEKGYKSITLNEDGSATYILTKKQHKEMMDSMADTINSSIKDLIGSEDYPTFKDIKANEDYTKFTITTTSDDLSLAESFSTMLFYTYGGMYSVFNGTEAENISVTFVNADTGKTISTSNSSDLEE